MCISAMCVGVPKKVGKSIAFTGVRILSGCELPEMGTGN